MSYKHFPVTFSEATAKQSHQGHRDGMPTEGGAGSGGCQWRILLQDNRWVQGADERSQSLYHRSPALPKPRASAPPSTKNTSCRISCGHNPLSFHSACADTLIFLFQLCGPGVRRCSAFPPAHQTKLKCSLFYYIKRFSEVQK